MTLVKIYNAYNNINNKYSRFIGDQGFHEKYLIMMGTKKILIMQMADIFNRVQVEYRYLVLGRLHTWFKSMVALLYFDTMPEC